MNQDMDMTKLNYDWLDKYVQSVASMSEEVRRKMRLKAAREAQISAHHAAVNYAVAKHIDNAGPLFTRAFNEGLDHVGKNQGITFYEKLENG